MAKTTTSADEQLSTSQAGAELGIGKTRVLVLIGEGRLPATRIGKFWAVRRADLDLVRHRPPGRPSNASGPRPTANADTEGTTPAPKKTKKKKK